jgi:hypothetical protein
VKRLVGPGRHLGGPSIGAPPFAIAILLMRFRLEGQFILLPFFCDVA